LRRRDAHPLASASVALLLLGYPKSKPDCAGISAVGGELLFVSRILIAASC